MKNTLQSFTKYAVVHSLLWLVAWVASVQVAQAQNGLAFMHGADDNSGAGTGVSIFVSNGDGTFKVAKTFDTGFARDGKGTEVFGDDGLSATFYVDATGDGVVDIVHATEFDGATVGNFIFVYPGTGKGGFAKTPILTSNNPGPGNLYKFAGIDCCQQSYMADVDGDGDIDYVFSGNDNTVNAYLNNGAGTFAITPVTTSLTGATAYFSSGVTPDEVGFLSDVNGDGKADLIHTNQYPSTTKVWLATSAGGFTATPVTTTGFQQTGASIFTGKGGNETSDLKDVTGDGKPDFIHTNEFSGANTIYVFAGNGLGGFATTFVSSVITNPPSAFNYVIGEYGAEFGQFVDVTGDARPDFVTSVDWLGANSGIYVYTNTGTGTFNATPIVSLAGCGSFQTGNDLTETTQIVKVFSGTTFATNGRPTSVTTSPGGVNADLAIWLRADDLASTQAEGSKVGVWSDAVTGGQAVTQGIDFYRPTYNKTTTSKLVNFNPSLSFNGDIANWLTADHRIYCNSSPFHLISLALDERTYKTEYRGPMGIGVDGNYPALDLYTDGSSPNGWRPFMGGSSPVIFNGGGALLYNGNTGGTNRQPQIFALSSTNLSPTVNFSADNIVSSVDSYTQATTLDAYQTAQIGNQLFIGSSGGEYWKGRIPEALVYTRQLTGAEQARVNSYLATKYGITLDQRTATSYVASDGTTQFWNATTNGIYKNDIGAIGRDDASGLNQKQSQSVNIMAQPIISLATIAVSNSANTGAFGADKIFAAWGDNGRPHSYSTVYSPTSFTPAGGVGFYRMAATWKMQLTGAVGNVFVGIPASSFADRLLISNTASFVPGSTQEILLTPDGKGNLVTSSAVTIANGEFFTFGAAQKAPGGVSANLTIWLKADAGVTASGTAISQWDNQALLSPYSVTQATATAMPEYVTSGSRMLNYNPTIYFNGSDVLFNNTPFMSGSSPYTFMMAAQDESDDLGVGTLLSACNVFDYFEFNKLNFGTLSNGWNPYGVGGNPDLGPFGKGNKFSPAGGVNGWYNGTGYTRNELTQRIQPQVVGFSSINSVASFGTSMTTWTDGYKDTPGWSFISESAGLAPIAQTYFFKELSIGADRGFPGTEPWEGPINEVIIYDRALSDNEAQRVNTYLAIKNGVTMGQGNGIIGRNASGVDYLATDNTVLWSTTANSSYNFDIAGIGQDNFEGLNQKQSKSVNVGFQPAIGLGTVEASNDLNAAAFTVDKSYMVWGSNGSGTTFNSNYTPNSFTSSAPTYLMSRIWKVQETGTGGPVGTVAVSIPGSSTGTYLIVSSTPSFTTGVPTEYAMTSDGAGNLVATVDLANGQYFTFAKSVYSPGCVAGGPALWLKGDVGLALNGTAVTGWADQGYSGALLVQNVAANQPAYTGTSLTNFNPAVTFDNTGTQQWLRSTPGSPDKIIDRSNGALYSVAKLTSSNNALLSGWDDDGNDPAIGITSTNIPFFYTQNSSIHNSGFSIINNSPFFFGTSWQNNMTGNNASNTITPEMRFNGRSANSLAVFNAYVTSLTVGVGGRGTAMEEVFRIGRDTDYGGITGDVLETIVFENPLTAPEKQRLESYFGIKYGMTLPFNYLSGAGSTIYDVSSYSANVTGIGRDDCQQLVQKQSRSVNSNTRLTIGLSTTIAATNADNVGSFSTNNAFLIAGANSGTGISPVSSTTSACPLPSPVSHYTNLAYKFTETGSVPASLIEFDASGFGFNPSFPLYMQIYSDATFTTLLASSPLSFSGGMARGSYDFPANSTSYVRFAGNTTSLANICIAPKPQTFHFNGWFYGTKTKTITSNYNLNNTLANPVMSVSVTDGTSDLNVLLYKPTVNWWPVFDGLGLFLPRYDNNTASQQNSIITTSMKFFAQSSLGVASTSLVAANTVDFVLRDIDGYIGGKDVVKVYGKLGAAIVFPKINKNNLYPSLASTALTISGNTITAGNLPWDLTVLGDAYVSFDSPVEEVVVEYTKQNQYGFKVYNDLRIGAVTVTCKAPTPRAPIADNVYVYKQATPSVQKTREPVVFKFTIQNTDCSNKVIDFSDMLPGGLTWVDSTITTSLNYASLNAYGNAQQLTISGMTVPPGTSYIYGTVRGNTQGSYANQVNYTVQGGTGATLLSDDPSESGTSFQPTPLTLVENDPEAELGVVKTVSAATSPQNSTLTYTYVITNPNATSAVLTTFTDVLPGEMTYIGSTLTGAGSASVSVYANEPVLTIRSLNIPAASSLTLTVQANTNSYTVGQVANNVAQVTPDVLSGFRIINYNSTVASTTISNFPSVTINTPPTNSTVALNSTVSGTATPGAQVVLTSSGTSGTLCTTTATIGGTWSCPVNLSAGPQTLSAVASNNVGTSNPATTQITVVNAVAPLTASNPPVQSAIAGATQTGNAAAELVPSGGTTPYSYSNDTGNSSCSAVAGATALPNANLTVVSGTGAYSYTAPSTPGTYYFCIKVCDSSSPTPQCVTKTYTLTVTALSGVGTLDCSTAQISGIVAGTSGNGVLKLSINVTQAGAMPVTVTGSGMATSPNPYILNPAATGVQTFYVPLTYSGAAFDNSTVISVTGAGTCTVNMTAVTPKTVSTSVLNLGPACTPATAATLVK